MVPSSRTAPAHRPDPRCRAAWRLQQAALVRAARELFPRDRARGRPAARPAPRGRARRRLSRAARRPRRDRRRLRPRSRALRRCGASPDGQDQGPADRVRARDHARGARARPAGARHLRRPAAPQRRARRRPRPAHPGRAARCLAHEQPNPRTEPGHAVEVAPGSRLHAIAGASRLEVNSAHHQAAGRVGPGVVVSGRAPDGVIEAIEAPGRRFCLGVQWHPEYAHLGRRRCAVRGADRRPAASR